MLIIYGIHAVIKRTLIIHERYSEDVQSYKTPKCRVQRGTRDRRGTRLIKSYPGRYRDGRRRHGRPNNETKPGNHKNDRE